MTFSMAGCCCVGDMAAFLALNSSMQCSGLGSKPVVWGLGAPRRQTEVKWSHLSGGYNSILPRRITEHGAGGNFGRSLQSDFPCHRLCCSASNGASDSDMAGGNASGERGDTPPPRDLSERRRRIQEAAAKIVGDPFRDMVTTASRRFQDYMEKQKGSTAKEVTPSEANVAKPLEAEGSLVAQVEGEIAEEIKEETAWERWQTVFAEVEEKYSLLEGLQVNDERAGR